MQARLFNRWDAIRNSFWFLPAVMSVTMAGLSLFCISLEGPTEQYVADLAPWVGVSTEAARSSLGAIAGAMVSIAGIVFSVMLVTLSVTSSQYGSRLLRTFMSDRATQFTLGMLVGTSLFCMLSLSGIRDHADGESPANVSVIIGLLLAILSLSSLVGFIHHVTNQIQAPNVVAAVASDLDSSFHRIFPRSIEEQSELLVPANAKRNADLPGRPVHLRHEGYVQAIDFDALLAIARTHNLFVELVIKPGDFVEREQSVVEVWRSGHQVPDGPPEKNGELELSDEIQDEINEAVITGRRRTPRQDPECALEELVEVAVRALSPGINDPFTAIACIDRLAASLGRVAQRAMPRQLRRDEQDVPRVVARATSFPDLMDATFNPLRQNGADCVAVAIRLVAALIRITAHISTVQQRESIARHAKMLERDFRRHVRQPEDGDDFQERFDELQDRLANSLAGSDPAFNADAQ